MTGLAAGIGLLPRVPLAACQPVFLGYFGAALADKQPVAPFSKAPFSKHVLNWEGPPMSTRIPMPNVDNTAESLQEKLEMSTAEIGLSVRTTNCLEERGIFTVEDLLKCSREYLLSISNFGEKTLEEVYKALEGVGFHRECL
jgi:DNA-directed RNA polymerase subunit alpha